MTTFAEWAEEVSYEPVAQWVKQDNERQVAHEAVVWFSPLEWALGISLDGEPKGERSPGQVNLSLLLGPLTFTLRREWGWSPELSSVAGPTPLSVWVDELAEWRSRYTGPAR